MSEFSFNRLKHPQKQTINQDSLMKCMNDFEVKISKGDNSAEFDRKVVNEMMKMINGGT